MEGIEDSSIKDSIKPVSIKKTETILDQMKTCVCKINNGQIGGTGFFTKLPFKKELISVLITSNHILGENEISNGKIITLSLNNNEIIKKIIIDSKRKTYTNIDYDTTIIELNEKDDIKDYLILDKHILEKINSEKDEISVNTNKFFKNEKASIYILNYAEEMFVSYGLLNNIDGNQISHKCYTKEGSSGSPILSLETNEVIGINSKGSKNNYQFNFGILLVEPVINFLSNFKNTSPSKLNMHESQINKHNTNQNIDKIYNDINKYFNTESDIINKLNIRNQKCQYQGFLVDKSWVDNWKRYSYYDEIKNKYLDKKNNNDKLIKKYIIDKQNNDNLNYNEINNVENFILKNGDKLKLQENQNKSFILLNSDFLRQFPVKLDISPISFYFSYKTIKLQIQGKKFYFETNNNIVINKENHKVTKKVTKELNQKESINNNYIYNEGYIPYSCIPQLEKNDKSFEETKE